MGASETVVALGAVLYPPPHRYCKVQKDYSTRKTLHISYKALSGEKVLTPALVALIRSIPTLSILKASEIDSDQSSHGWGLGPKPPPPPTRP